MINYEVLKVQTFLSVIRFFYYDFLKCVKITLFVDLLTFVVLQKKKIMMYTCDMDLQHLEYEMGILVI